VTLAIAGTGSSSGARGGSALVLGSALPPRMPASVGQLFYVNGTRGKDSWTGTKTRPWRTINHAFAVVPLSGSTILVRSGTYQGEHVFKRQGNPNNPVTIRPYGTENVTLTGPAGTLYNAVAVRNGRGLRIEDFDIKAYAANSGIRVENGRDVEIVDNDLHDAAHNGILVVGICQGGNGCNSNIQVWNNRFHNNGGYWAFENPYWYKGDHSIYWGGVSNAGNRGLNQSTYGGVIANNLFYDQPTGRELQIGSQVDGLIVTNNTFVYSKGDPHRYAGSAIEVYGESNPYATKNVRILNNIIAWASYWGVYGSGPAMPSNLVENNLAYGNAYGDFNNVNDDYGPLYTLGPGNLTGENPLLVNPAELDFHLQLDSPAIGKSDSAYTPGTDFDGRPRHSQPDLGAYDH
jgi:hypothetical protein